MDMLLKLYELPPWKDSTHHAGAGDVIVRRAMAYESRRLIRWVDKTFNALWADECAAAFGQRPVGCYLAHLEQDLLGFCCLDVTFNGFIGPIGVHEDSRGRGVGSRLLHCAAHDLRMRGYAYAVIGDVGAAEFFKKAAGAVEIPDSTPGAYPRRF